ncbi:MAG: nucleotidyltransferase family protein [Oscillospiraceae bacterium]|nr:nucleotidyltransferase family protein [Oscillospiraceae bacterium]
MNAIEDTVISLCRCVVNNLPIDASLLENTDLDALYQLCRYHSVTSLVCYGLESVGIRDTAFVQAKEKSIRKNLLLDAERKRILQFMDEQKIWNMPLKGIWLKELYPRVGMRQMSDNDILFNADKRSEVSEFMKKSGYHNLNTMEVNLHCDEWVKEPLYNFEMHFSLFSMGGNDVFYHYYKDVFSKLIRVSESGYTYRFTDEDYYIYLTAHAFKHYDYGGIGIRTLIDNYVYLKSKEKELDWDYISAELQKLHIAGFEQRLRTTSQHVFSPDPISNPETEEMLDYMFQSGTYGNVSNVIQREFKMLNARNKKEYLVRRIFPNMNFYRKNFPVAARYPVLIPFAWLFRLVRAPFKRRESICKELKILQKMDRQTTNNESESD